MEKKNNKKVVESNNKKSSAQENKNPKNPDGTASHDTYGSGYEKKRNDYRSQLGQDSAAEDATSFKTKEGHTHRSSQEDHLSNNNQKDVDSYQE